METVVTIKVVRHGAYWINPMSKEPFSAVYDDITDTYVFISEEVGDVFDIYKVISDDEVLITQWAKI